MDVDPAPICRRIQPAPAPERKKKKTPDAMPGLQPYHAVITARLLLREEKQGRLARAVLAGECSRAESARLMQRSDMRACQAHGDVRTQSEHWRMNGPGR